MELLFLDTNLQNLMIERQTVSQATENDQKQFVDEFLDFDLDKEPDYLVTPDIDLNDNLDIMFEKLMGGIENDQ